MLWSLVALVAVGTSAVLIAQSLAADLELREASLRGGAFARNVVARLVNAELRAGSADQSRAIDEALRTRFRDGTLIHVKVWSEEGVVLWADRDELIGKRFDLGVDIRALFGTLDVIAELSNLSKEENRGERRAGELLEVYAGSFDRDNQAVVVESYWSTARLHRDEVAILVRFVPLSLGALLLYSVAMLSVAVSFARRMDGAHAERSAMLRHALSASDLERRRIARELHDGLIQDIAGLGYTLPLVAAELPSTAVAARKTLEDVTTGLQSDIASLRSVLAEVYPVDLSQEGLPAAVEKLAERARESGLQVDVALEASPADLPPEAARLVYQIVREGLHNAAKHAEAATVTLVVAIDRGDVVVTVTDDGKGLSGRASDEGHFGLRLLQDTVRDVGGKVSLRNLQSGGTQLTARFPRSFGQNWPV